MSLLAGLYWRESAYLWLCLSPFIALPLLAYWQAHQLDDDVDAALRPWAMEPAAHSVNRRGLVILVLSWVLLCVALAGPRTVLWLPPQAEAPRATVMAVLDLSASMGARDERPSRRGKALALLQAVTGEPLLDMRMGLVLFAGHAHLLSPPSRDAGVMAHYLASVDGLPLPTLGNALAAAIDLAAAQLLAAPDSPRKLLLITDGDLDPQARAAAEAAIARLPEDTALLVLGMGGDEPVAVPDPVSGWLKDDQQQPVSSRGHRSWLRQLATLGGGQFQHRERLAVLQSWLQPSTLRLDRARAEGVIWQEWFALPLLAGLALMFAVLLRPGGGGMWLLVLGVWMGTGPQPVSADMAAARASLVAGDFQSARKQFAGQSGYVARFGEGVVCYRLAEDECAQQAFARAAFIAGSELDHARAVFNLANSHFRLGDYDQAELLFEAVSRLKSALGDRLDLTAEQIATNLSFARSLAESVRRQLEKIAALHRRLNWREAVNMYREMEPDTLASEMNLLRPRVAGSELDNSMAAMKWRGLLRALNSEGLAVGGAGSGVSGLYGAHWGEADGLQQSQSSTALLKRLLEMELGFPASLQRPRELEGKRPW